MINPSSAISTGISKLMSIPSALYDQPDSYISRVQSVVSTTLQLARDAAGSTAVSNAADWLNGFWRESPAAAPLERRAVSQRPDPSAILTYPCRIATHGPQEVIWEFGAQRSSKRTTISQSADFEALGDHLGEIDLKINSEKIVSLNQLNQVIENTSLRTCKQLLTRLIRPEIVAPNLRLSRKLPQGVLDASLATALGNELLPKRSSVEMQCQTAENFSVWRFQGKLIIELSANGDEGEFVGSEISGERPKQLLIHWVARLMDFGKGIEPGKFYPVNFTYHCV